MLIAITSEGPTLQDRVDQRFGRCPYLIIVDLETMKFDAIENPYAKAGSGAGIQSAQLVADRDVSVILTGNPGPKAQATFDAADIKVVSGAGGTVQETIDKYKNGSLR